MRFLRVLWHPSGRADGLHELHKAVGWEETKGLRLSGAGAGTAPCPPVGLYCSTLAENLAQAVAAAIVCREWLLHANQSAVAIFNPKF